MNARKGSAPRGESGRETPGPRPDEPGRAEEKRPARGQQVVDGLHAYVPGKPRDEPDGDGPGQAPAAALELTHNHEKEARPQKQVLDVVPASQNGCPRKIRGRQRDKSERRPPGPDSEEPLGEEIEDGVERGRKEKRGEVEHGAGRPEEEHEDGGEIRLDRPAVGLPPIKDRILPAQDVHGHEPHNGHVGVQPRPEQVKSSETGPRPEEEPEYLAINPIRHS